MSSVILSMIIYAQATSNSLICSSFGRYLNSFFFFDNNPPPPEFSTLPLHDALPICRLGRHRVEQRDHRLLEGMGDVDTGEARGARGSQQILEPAARQALHVHQMVVAANPRRGEGRSEEHTSELQSPCNLVCRLLLEK